MSRAGDSEREEVGDATPGRETLDVSVVVPVFDEQDSVEACYRELRDVLDATGLAWELIFVDDGSRDESMQRLFEVCTGDPRCTVIEFRRNFGQTAAMAAGFDEARGRVVVPMDRDLQYDPRDIPALLGELEGHPECDIVSGWRRDRQDPLLTRRLPSRVANWIIGKVTGVRLHDHGCTLKAYRREVVKDIRLYGEMHRFLPAIATWRGGRVREKVVNHRPRVARQSKYGLSRTFKVLLDLVTVKFMGSYLTKPMYFFGKLSLWSFLAAWIVLGVALYQKFVSAEHLHLNRSPLLLLSAILVVLSAQLVLMGLMMEMLVRTYFESQRHPTYVIRKIHHAQPVARRTEGSLSGDG